MSKDLTVKNDVAKDHELSVIERVVMQGDLSKLDATQRVTYYNKVCDSMGLNPYTRPFDYISLNGKLTLYAKKDATEQLRQVKRISIISLEGRMVDDLYIVVAKASTPDGRLDQSTGAVSIGHLKGEAKANAIMKAETKAKRRVTLSISGMGWTDESEIESIPNAKCVNVDMETGEFIDIPNPQISHKPPATQSAPPNLEPQADPVDLNAQAISAFCAKHAILITKDGVMTNPYQFVFDSAKNSNMSIDKVLDFAINNEAQFIKRYEKWFKERFKTAETPTSMSDLVY